MEQLRYHDVLYNDDPIGAYPTHLLKRVERAGKWWFSLDEVDGELVVPTGENRQKICRDYPLR